jgi:hypothetical protein
LKTSRREFLFFFIKKAGLGPLEVLFTLIWKGKYLIFLSLAHLFFWLLPAFSLTTLPKTESSTLGSSSAPAFHQNTCCLSASSWSLSVGSFPGF